MISFKRDQLFIVTGAGSGIGRASAQLLVNLGASVVGVGRNTKKLEEARIECSCPDAFSVCSYDLTKNIENIGEWVCELRKKYGKFHGLVSCAGQMYMDGLRNYTYGESISVIDLHLHVPLMLAQAVADRRNCTGVGTSLVFISALGGVIPQVGLLTYGSAKAGLIAGAKNMSKELGKRQIRVNVLSPALVRTPMTEKDYAGVMGHDVLAAEAEHFPLGLGQPDDVAYMAVFLLSSCARWISGQNIVLDGGRY